MGGATRTGATLTGCATAVPVFVCVCVCLCVFVCVHVCVCVCVCVCVFKRVTTGYQLPLLEGHEVRAHVGPGAEAQKLTTVQRPAPVRVRLAP